MPQGNSSVKERSRSDLKEPGKYNVIFHNDDFTPMDFVVILLINIFYKDINEAETLMLKVHNEGQAVVGSYSYDIAMTKARNATGISRANGYPLRISVQPA
ncbi:MAG: ATP-dependent Clp protease adaptor ClpS [Muribaculaceae bacterium]|nr:ATP-dependent Clp protease adaptor ClpS [Muribaculaceae bacterium]